MRIRQHPHEFAEYAARLVENAHAKNERVFAYYRANPIDAKTDPAFSAWALSHHAYALSRIAPYLPQKVPHWMRPA